jgi:hypothetical protein
MRLALAQSQLQHDHLHATGCFRCGESTGRAKGRAFRPYTVQTLQVRRNGLWLPVRVRIHRECSRAQHNAGHATDARAERFGSHAYAPRPSAERWER